MTRKPLDIAVEKAEKILLERAVTQNKMKPLLDKQLGKAEVLDKKISYHQTKIKELEEEKQKELSKLSELLDLAVLGSHALPNGYTAMPDDRRKIVVNSIGDFMKWLKVNKSTDDVFEFFEGAMKLTKLKRFCEEEVNRQRLNGEISPSIDGVEIGKVTFRRLTTKYKGKK